MDTPIPRSPSRDAQLSLAVAIEMNRPAKAKAALEAGASARHPLPTLPGRSFPNADPLLDWTPLMHAAKKGSAALCELLLPLSDPLASNSYGVDALMLAASQGNLAALEILLPHCDPRAQSVVGMTAMMHAAERCHLECAMLLAPASDLSARNGLGKSAFDLFSAPVRAACQAAVERSMMLRESDAPALRAGPKRI